MVNKHLSSVVLSERIPLKDCKIIYMGVSKKMYYDVVECSPHSTVTSDLIRPAANAAVSRAHRGGPLGRALQDVAM